MEGLRERLRDAALEPTAAFDWDGALRRATRRRRARFAGIGVAACVVLALIGIGIVALVDGDSDGGRVVATQPPGVDEVQLNERWLIAPVPPGFSLEGVDAEAADPGSSGSSTTTTARFRSEDGAELLVRDDFGDGVPSFPDAWFEAEGVEEREIAFTEVPVQEAGYRAAGEVDEYQHLGWRYSEYGTFEILFDESLSFDDARAFAAALRRAGTPPTVAVPTG